MPYFNRVRLGEGGLVVFNLFYSIYAHRDWKMVIIETLVSFIILCLLYGFNDYSDRDYDIINAKKDQNFSRRIIEHSRSFLVFNTLLTTIIIVFVSFAFDPLRLLAVCFVFLINYTYSKKLKSFPLVDILAVIFWGGVFVMLSGRFSIYLICTAGIMTGISHLFQMMTDKSSDVANKIKTTVVALPGSESLLLAILFIVLGVMIFSYLGLWWAMTVSIPFLFYVLSKNVTLSWYVARIYFFICWLGLLNSYYGSF